MSKATPKADESPRRHYAVQVAAYARRADADAMADRLNRKGLNAHVDGSEKPFRVRLGRYDNYAEAAKALRELKAKNISGFVSETDQ
jgi:cell division protein FtsN